MIEGSLRCFKRGWLALLPVAGMGFAVAALLSYSRVFLDTRDDWNPAKIQLYSGAGLAIFSLLIHGLFATAVIVKALS